MSDGKISALARRSIAGGEELYSERRQARSLAADLTPGHVQNIATGRRAVTDEVKDAIVAGLHAEAERMRTSAVIVDEIVSKILKAGEK